MPDALLANEVVPPLGTAVARKAWAAAAATSILVLVTSVALAAAPTPKVEDRDESGIAVMMPLDRVGMVDRIKQALASSGRFRIVVPPRQAIKAKLPGLVPDPPLTLTQRNRMLSETPAHWLLFASVATRSVLVSAGNGLVASSSVELTARVLDLVLGDTGPLFKAASADANALQAQLLKFLRVQYPLSGHVTAVREDTVYLDIGRQDGVMPDSLFLLRRYPDTLNLLIGSVQIQSRQDWYSTGTIQDLTRGARPQIGDLVIEDPATFLGSP